MAKLWTAEEVAFLVEFFASHGAKHVSEKLGRSIGTVKSKASKMGIRQSKEATKANFRAFAEKKIAACDSVNWRLFEDWSPDMAYILGYMWADASVNQKYSMVVMLTTAEDGYLLEWIKDKIKSSHKIQTVYNTIYPGVPYKQINLTSTALARILRDKHGL